MIRETPEEQESGERCVDEIPEIKVWGEVVETDKESIVLRHNNKKYVVYKAKVRMHTEVSDECGVEFYEVWLTGGGDYPFTDTHYTSGLQFPGGCPKRIIYSNYGEGEIWLTRVFDSEASGDAVQIMDVDVRVSDCEGRYVERKYIFAVHFRDGVVEEIFHTEP